MNTECPFCQTFGDRPILARTDYWTLAPDYYPICDGHLLVISNLHVCSFASIANSMPVQSFYNAVGQKYHRVYGSMILYEHGNATENRTDNPSVDHAHLHVLPWSSTSRIEMLAAEIGLDRRFDGPCDSLLTVLIGKDYHILTDCGNYIYYTTRKLSSRVLRSAYQKFILPTEGRSISNPTYQAVFNEYLLESFRCMLPTMQRNPNALPHGL